MAQLNNKLEMSETALGKEDDKKKKKPTLEEIKFNVSKKLFIARENRRNEPPKKELNNRIVNTSGSYDFADVKGKGLEATRTKKTMARPKNTDVFQSLKDGVKSPEKDKGMFSGSSTGLISDSLLKTKKYQDRTNKILGKQ